ncbi:2-oxoglutarate carboxylase large subunit [Geodia barretti]|uniref:2-oxoglutarate carboxylase large subunit n=1 Tax=Geodia barretti TaxID=519541 RepID=A0AA35S2G0_GEOBA|nr:2-oxoglutarate carboxylase large subunit [Geodia barretti]
MPGSVLEVLVSEGDRVEQNQTVVLMESMKMELVITAPRSGVVRRVAVEPGQQVQRGMRLLELAPDNDDGER